MSSFISLPPAFLKEFFLPKTLVYFKDKSYSNFYLSIYLFIYSFIYLFFRVSDNLCMRQIFYGLIMGMNLLEDDAWVSCWLCILCLHLGQKSLSIYF